MVDWDNHFGRLRGIAKYSRIRLRKRRARKRFCKRYWRYVPGFVWRKWLSQSMAIPLMRGSTIRDGTVFVWRARHVEES